jgi:hypothetical protein
LGFKEVKRALNFEKSNNEAELAQLELTLDG